MGWQCYMLTGLLVAPRNGCGCICQTTAKEALLRIPLAISINQSLYFIEKVKN